jgi:RNA recognition motif-containing protein
MGFFLFRIKVKMFSVFVIYAVLCVSFCQGLLHGNPRIFSSRPLSMSDIETPQTIVEQFHQLYIGNLPFDVDESVVRSMLTEKTGGTFQSFRLNTDRMTGKCRGFGYIDFVSKSDADTALEQLSGMMLDGKEVKINTALPRGEKHKVLRNEHSCFIGNLPYHINEADIMDVCNEKLGTGVAIRVRLARDKETGQARGFGHIDFSSNEDVESAITALADAEIQGRPLRIDVARRKELNAAGPPGSGAAYTRAPRTPTSMSTRCTVFVGNLAWDVSDSLLREMLDDVVGVGAYSNVRLAMDRDSGMPKGYAHIDFADRAAAERGVSLLDNLELNGRALRVDLSKPKLQ